MRALDAGAFANVADGRERDDRACDGERHADQTEGSAARVKSGVTMESTTTGGRHPRGFGPAPASDESRENPSNELNASLSIMLRTICTGRVAGSL